MEAKTCSVCGETKTTRAFYRDASRKDGLTDRCKVCVSEYLRSRFPQRDCVQCGKRYRPGSKESIYCSIHCAHEPQRTYAICKHCGVRFVATAGRLGHCSRNCRDADRRATIPRWDIRDGLFSGKTCHRCGAWKLRSDFATFAASWDGYNATCRRCLAPALCARTKLRNRKYPHATRLKKHLCRARARGAHGHSTAQEWEALCAKHGGRCLRCHAQAKLTVDHIVPVSRGGSSDISNLQPLCAKCNSIKHTKTIDYRPSRARGGAGTD